jgi:hypothetical protein
MEYLCDLSTFRISYPQFLAVYPQFCGEMGLLLKKVKSGIEKVADGFFALQPIILGPVFNHNIEAVQIGI